MIHLDLTNDHNAIVYLDVHRVEPKDRAGGEFVLTGTLGDGLDEGEVLLEVGEGVEVTFVDEWLGGGRLRQLFGRIGRETVRLALTEAAAGLRFCLQGFPADTEAGPGRVTGFCHRGRWVPLRPREYGEQMELPLHAAEEETGWAA